ncbi:MAG TPA: lipid-A-disaccharide synthase [Candidatus Dormibacteraeota bacterium]|nr:lipid-A-disaccharide synthase [Candidatus Dormibacteraeota bacterium]
MATAAYNALLRILISAGEASGEMYGAQLIEGLRRRDASLEFFGGGGDRMRAAGCDTVVDAKDLSVVGITEILGHLPKIYGLYKHLIAEADRRKPNLAIVIDSPAFNWRVARQMKKRGIPVVYYVAPQFWAWRRGRVRLLRNYIDKALVIFPFEEKFYRDRGVDATFVGHPLAELPRPAIDRGDYAVQFHLDPSKHWITLMPGSRVKEVRMNLPTILQTAARLGPNYEFLLPVAPTLDRAFLQNLIDAKTIAQPRITLVPDSLPALHHSRIGIIASGTATVEAAMMRTPFVMVYCVSPVTYILGKPRIKVPYFAMVNLIAGEQIVPELVQHDFTPQNVVTRLQEILPDGLARTRMLEGLTKVKAQLLAPEGNLKGSPLQLPADRAAEIILALLRRTQTP